MLHNKNDDPTKLTPMQEIEQAYRECSFGRFHIKLICVTFLSSTSISLVTNTTSYLLPIAECDLVMNLLQKGLLNAAPFIGMSVTSVIAGFLTDTFGRKLFLKVGFGGVCVFCIVGGLSQTYAMLVFAKFCEGLLLSISMGAYVPYLSEFCHKGIRDRMILAQSSLSTIAQIISPAMAMGVLSHDWNYSMFNGYFVLHTWNFYIFLMSIWSFFSCLFYCTLPESPKYLLTKHKYDEAREILIKMYKENTRKPVETFSYINIWKTIPVDNAKDKKEISFTHQIGVGLRNTKPLFQKPLVFSLILLGVESYILICMFDVLRLWFPQLSTIAEHYNLDAENDMCAMLDAYTNDLNTRSNSTVSKECVPKKSGPETFFNSMIIGLVCLLVLLITGILVNKVGKRRLLVVSGLIAAAVMLGLRWANSKLAIVALFAIGTAILQVMKSLNQATAVEYFPTRMRSFGVACIMLTGRVGTLSGNIGFPVLLDMGCVVPFFTMTGMLIFVITLGLFIPKIKESL